MGNINSIPVVKDMSKEDLVDKPKALAKKLLEGQSLRDIIAEKHPEMSHLPAPSVKSDWPGQNVYNVHPATAEAAPETKALYNEVFETLGIGKDTSFVKVFAEKMWWPK